TGYLVKQTYVEGSAVRKGDVLFEIDPRTFQASVDQARGQLAQAQAQLGRASLDLERDRPLAEAHAIPRRQLEDEVQARAAAAAAVDSARATLRSAQLNLEFTKVRSLTDGVAGIARGQIGDLVGPATLLTTVSRLDPIKAYVSISEKEYLRFVGGLEGGGEARAPYPAGDAPLEAARRGIPRLVELAEGKQATDLLFGYHDRAWPRLWVKRICRDTGVPEITAHGMRGTHSTVALDSGKR